jgi:hypothetical protein
MILIYNKRCRNFHVLQLYNIMRSIQKNEHFLSLKFSQQPLFIHKKKVFPRVITLVISYVEINV